MVSMAGRTSSLSFERRGSVAMLRGRRVLFRICRYERKHKRKRWMVWWAEAGKRYRGWRPLHNWYSTEAEAVAAVKRNWRAVRGGLLYPKD